MDLQRDNTTADMKEKWGSQIARKFGGKLPVLSKLHKDGEKSDIRFRSLSRLVNLAATICQVSSFKFNHPGEVHRAAHYIGMHVLFNMFGDADKVGFDKTYGSKIYKVLQANEAYRIQCILLDDVLNGARNLLNALRDGILKPAECEEKVAELIDAMPKELRTLTRNKVKELSSGRNVTELRFNASRGGDQRAKG